MTPLVDTNVLIGHLTHDPKSAGKRATSYLANADTLLLADVVIAETIYVLESYYELERETVADLVRSIILFDSIRTIHPELLLRSLEVYTRHRIDYAEAYLVATSETIGSAVVSFDKSIDRVTTISRIEP